MTSKSGVRSLVTHISEVRLKQLQVFFFSPGKNVKNALILTPFKLLSFGVTKSLYIVLHLICILTIDLPNLGQTQGRSNRKGRDTSPCLLGSWHCYSPSSTLLA